MNRLREVMREQERTFEQVAAEAGVSVRTVYNAADGRNSNKSTRKLIAAVLGKDVEYLWPVVPTSPQPLPPPQSDATPADAQAVAGVAVTSQERAI